MSSTGKPTVKLGALINFRPDAADDAEEIADVVKDLAREGQVCSFAVVLELSGGRMLQMFCGDRRASYTTMLGGLEVLKSQIIGKIKGRE